MLDTQIEDNGEDMASAANLSVLIVEDSEIVRSRLVRLLEAVGGVSIVGCADDGIKAMGLFAEHRPEVVLLDIELPGLNGFKLLEAFKRELPGTRVIVLTTYASAEFGQICARLGADYFLNKAREFGRVPQILAEMLAALDQKSEETYP